MDPALAQQITQAFVSITSQDAAGKAVLEGEACGAFVPGMLEGWDALEQAAEQEGLI
jgi:ABC-type phosphate/phosphonate transport system substrate-binding protein